MDLSGKVAVITGGASGIGGAATRAFAAAGAKVAFTYQTSAEEAERIEAECRDAGHSALGIACDVRDPDAVTALFDRVNRELGSADVLFANAGGLLKRQRCTESTLELWQEAMAVNVYTAFLVTQAALRQMEPRCTDSTVVMSSLAAFDGGGPGASHYAARACRGTSPTSFSTSLPTARRS